MPATGGDGRGRERAAKGGSMKRVSKLEAEERDPFNKEGSGRMVIYTPEVLRSALHNAAAEGSLDNVKLCVERGASPLWRDEGDGACGLTTLQVAVCSAAEPKEKVALLRYLHEEERMELNDIDYIESTALHHAAALGEPEVIDYLIKQGANPKVYDAEGLTPLHVAANNGHVAAVRALINNWAPVDAGDATEDEEGEGGEDAPNLTPLEQMRKRSESAKRRVTHAASGLYIARRGAPLHICAAASRVLCARALLEAGGADPDSPAGAQGSAPLHIAARCGDAAMCALLLDAGASANARDELGETPLFRAIEGEHLGVARALMARGAEAGVTNAVGLTPLHVAAACGLIACFRPLVEGGADPNARCHKTYKDWDGGRTPMHYAAHHGSVDAFKELESLGGDPRLFSSMTSAWGEAQPGWPPLFYAVEAKNLALCEWIMGRDADEGVHCVVSARRTPLMVAAMQGWSEGADAILRRYPFYLNWRDDLGRTALHWAARRSEGPVMEMLVETHGADKMPRDNDGKTPGDMYSGMTRPPPKRMWEEERVGAMGERRWDYAAVMENTGFRYLRRATAARRTREIARERQCAWCGRFAFDAKRCGACKAAWYCGGMCQAAHWGKGGHRLVCLTKYAAAAPP